MKRSQNEIYRLCHKAARGAGAPAGLECDVARAAAWLSVRGLPALETLADDLSRSGSGRDAHIVRVSPGEPIDAGGKSGALLAPLLVDMMLTSGIDEGKPLMVKNLSLPLYLLPAAAGYAENGRQFDFFLRSSSGRFHVTIAPGPAVSIDTSTGATISALADGPFDVIARCDSLTDLTASKNGGVDQLLIDDDALSRAADLNLADGIEVDARTWNVLSAYAANTLVPATAQSRRGAGAAGSDNE